MTAPDEWRDPADMTDAEVAVELALTTAELVIAEAELELAHMRGAAESN